MDSHSWGRLQKSNQRKKDWPTTLICPKFYFSTLYDSHVFSYEFNKGSQCSKSPTETVYRLLIWAMREPSIYYLCLLSLFFFLFLFLFLFPCHVIFAHGLCPYLLLRSPFRVFNLVGFLCLNFCLGRFWVLNLTGFFLFLFQTLYFQSLSRLIGQRISSPSKFVILVAPPDMFF